MATRVYLREIYYPVNTGDTLTLATSVTIGAAVVKTLTIATVAGNGSTELQVQHAGAPSAMNTVFVTERLAGQVTLTGTITVKLLANANPSANAALRVKLSKITYGGSDLETFIGTATMASALTATDTAYTFTITPSPALTLAENERLILRIYAVSAPGVNMASGFTVTVKYNTNATSLADSYLEITEAASFKPSGARLYLRRTAVAGIGTFFDMVPTRGSTAFTTGVVNTVASGTEIQWTRTAGGTLLEWISPPVKYPFMFRDNSAFASTFSAWAVSSQTWPFESATTANVGLRTRLFRRRPDGTETEVLLNSGLLELATAASKTNSGYSSSGSTFTDTPFMPDDRIVARFYIIPVGGTMAGARTATMNYDHNVADVNGDSYFDFLENIEFKAEGDPLTPATIPSSGTMSGVQN